MKEVNTIKSLVDIPRLKEDREKYKRQLEEINVKYESQQQLFQRMDELRQVSNGLHALESWCYTDNPEYLQKSIELATYLSGLFENAEAKLAELTKEKEKTEEKIRNINEDLKKARALV